MNNFLKTILILIFMIYGAETLSHEYQVGSGFKVLIERYEGLRLNVYNDMGIPVKRAKNGDFVVPTRGYLHIGYGHKLTNAEIKCRCFKLKNQVVSLDKPITKKQAYKLLKKDVVWVDNMIDRFIKPKLTQNQYDAVASYIYNCGYLALFHRKNGKIRYKYPRNILKYIRQGEVKKAMRYINYTGKFNFLRKRRKAERKLAIEGVL